MDSIEKIEKDFNDVLPMKEINGADHYKDLQLRILIQIAYQLQGLTAAIKNMRDV